MEGFKSFTEQLDEIKSNVSVNAKGKKVKSFSKTDFDKSMKALVNDVEFTEEVAKVKGDAIEKEEVKPVEMYRKGHVKSILQAAGHDKAEAEQLALSIPINNVDGIYELIDAGIVGYLGADKKFNFLRREDMTASLSIEDVAAKEVPYRDLKTQEHKVSYQDSYKKLVCESKCPSNRKKK